MKQLFVLLLCLALCFTAYSEGSKEIAEEPEITEELPEPEEESQPRYTFITDLVLINGVSWMKWMYPQKITYLAGILTAQGAILIALSETNEIELSEEEKEKLFIWLNFVEPLEIIIQKIDNYYINTDDLGAVVWTVLYVLYNKEWWKLEKIEMKKNEKIRIINNSLT